MAILSLGIVIAFGVRFAPLADAEVNRFIALVGLALAGVVGFYNIHMGLAARASSPFRVALFALTRLPV
ncbi:hypothetical protein [Rhizobium sp. R693]|uniref:hypothetical protein n=1 Tax=Rhizobium sp. R693 TaxID=1764276 RepID=UPI000B5321EF|nr:hypothetical protein [Rhizobium sp. R693]OWV90391.1 hypothetical protein ATY79_28535 [Rhizobium sp. R693]